MTLDELEQIRQKNLKKDEDDLQISKTERITRAAAQGITFGFGDELEALFMSQIKGTSYKEEVNKIRDDIDRFRETNPVLAYGSEIGASIPTLLLGGAALRGAGLATKAVRGGSATRAAAVGAGQGAVYGAGTSEGELTTAEGLKDRLVGGAVGASLGGAISGGATLVLPRTTKASMDLIKKGVPVTPGAAKQGAGGSLTGQLIGGLETASTSLPGGGAFISGAKTKALAEFNKVAMLEAIEPIVGSASKRTIIKKITDGFAALGGKQTPLSEIRGKIKGLVGNDAYDAVADLVSKEYTKVLSKMKLEGNDLRILQERIVDKINNAGLSNEAIELVNKRMTFLINNQIKTNKKGVQFLNGDALKKIETNLFDEIMRYNRKGGVESYIGDAFTSIRDVFKTSITEFNPNNSLGKVNLAFAQLKPIEYAVKSAFKNKGIFSTAQFLNGIKAVDRSIRKSTTARGKNLMLGTAREAEEVLGNFTPDSGTANRLFGAMTTSGEANISSLLNPLFFLGAGYSPGVMQALRFGLDVPGMAARSVSPFAAGQTTQGLLNNRGR